ncbi:MAG: alpha/beta hydrolase, partial [Kiritimatiellae bacterium]|nr:alpha/beta hydrolase [Kiritimatiellia bacterium]
LPLAVSSVDFMYRWRGLRYVCGGSSSIPDRTGEPWNMPDAETCDVDVFFLHGFNVSEADARNWSRQVFKRLWLSGSRARFHGFSWYGDYNLAGSTFNGLHYHQDVYHALKTAAAFKGCVEATQPVSSKRVVLAHSLGNMVAAEALRQGLEVGKYFMFNAAVASEAVDGTLQNADAAVKAKYVPSDWHSYTNACWAANWFRWFQNDTSDARGRMGWPDYFSAALGNAGTVYNYYSSGDLVFMEAETPPGLTAGLFHWPTLSWTWPFVNLNITEEAHSWQKQETRKGIDPMAGTFKGGWGFHCWYETVGGEPVQEYYTAAQANAMAADCSITNSPVFSCGGTSLNNRNASQDDVWLSLAKYVPAVSAPIGGSSPFDDNNVDLDDATNSTRPNGWGRTNEVYGQKWLHSDMKDMAFFYLYPFFIDLATKGYLK